jgi:hypothetical protein
VLQQVPLFDGKPTLGSQLCIKPGPWLVQRDDKLPAAVRTFRRRKQDHGSRPRVDSLLFAVWAFDQMFVETKVDKIDFGHGEILRGPMSAPAMVPTILV